MLSFSTSVAYAPITLTALGISFYFGVVAANTFLYEPPFQIPASTTLRGEGSLIPIVLRTTGSYSRITGTVKTSQTDPQIMIFLQDAQERDKLAC